MVKRVKEVQEAPTKNADVEQVAEQDEQDKQQSLEAYIQEIMTQDHEVEVDLNSLEARVGYGSLLREFQKAFVERVAFYRSDFGGALSVEEARARAYHACKDDEEAKRIYN